MTRKFRLQIEGRELSDAGFTVDAPPPRWWHGYYANHNTVEDSFTLIQKPVVIGIIFGGLFFLFMVWFDIYDPEEINVPLLYWRLIELFLALVFLWCVGFYRRVVFDRNQNSFLIERKMFWIDRTPIKGTLEEIKAIRYEELVSKKKISGKISIKYKDECLYILEIIGRRRELAERLSKFIFVPLETHLVELPD